MRFIVSEEFRPKGKWTSLPQAALRVYLTCPKCGNCYSVCHKQCGMHVQLPTALSPNANCVVCQSNGQNGNLPVDIADCPSCGFECRSIEQLDYRDDHVYSKRMSTKAAGKPRRPPKIKGPCAICGSHVGTDVHHIDWDHNNNEKSNLTTVCHHCHEQAHKLGKPLFDELVQSVNSTPAKKETLLNSSLRRYRELYGTIPDDQQPRLLD